MKTSIDADVLAKDSTTSESVDDNIGKTSFILLSPSEEYIVKTNMKSLNVHT